MEDILPKKATKDFKIKQVIAFVYHDPSQDGQFFVPIRLVGPETTPAIAADQEGLEIIKSLIQPWAQAHPEFIIRALRMKVTEDITDLVL